MARTDFGPEVKASMQPNANKPVSGDIPEREPASVAKQEQIMARDSGGNTNRLPRVGPGRGGMPGMPHTASPRLNTAAVPHAIPPDAPHVAAAASIAHAILGNRGV